ncbi:hypothetical protein IVA93_37600 (plasmid) [Bradyrhizobium sp. 155]|uniref:hypothetical protein n=1 Tax=Bradyrhizobium sp. 155 TaxID=2782629 RepID=UPI001FFF8D99|nr:hypothetical protein [Bradyrhizobium sp. 155]UPK15825.1 hypothetical protein IVA93_37600 [Bradyrhizobium sp. 155]
MPLFLKTDCPPDMPDNLLSLTNQAIERLQAKLLDHVVIRDAPKGLYAPALAQCFIQAHLRRMLMFVEGGYAEFRAGRPLMTEMATRAIYENIAVFCDYSTKLQALCEAGDYAGLSDLTNKYTFATRFPPLLESGGSNSKATQILNQIDKMDKRVETYREAYEHLSDIVHPNGLGAVIYFGKHDDKVMTFHPQGAMPERAMQALTTAATLLLTVYSELDAMEKSLDALTESSELG